MGQVFGDDVLAIAILDRLLHHCEVLSINGPSYRLKNRFTALEGGADVARSPQPSPRREVVRSSGSEVVRGHGLRYDVGASRKDGSGCAVGVDGIGLATLDLGLGLVADAGPVGGQNCDGACAAKPLSGHVHLVGGSAYRKPTDHPKPASTASCPTGQAPVPSGTPRFSQLSRTRTMARPSCWWASMSGSRSRSRRSCDARRPSSGGTAARSGF